MNRQVVKWLVTIFLVLSLVLVAACSSKPEATEKTGDTPAPAKADQTTQNEVEPAMIDPLGKYDPPIEVTTARGIESVVKFGNGESADKNGVYDAYLRDLGIQIKNDWVVDASQYNQKVKISIASGAIPDFLRVTAEEFQQLLEADMIMDLTDVYDQYATDEVKEAFMLDGGTQLETAKDRGKLMAIPMTNSPYNRAQMLWIRKDWLTKLNLPEPKTMQDLNHIIEEFVKQNPGGAKKTYGLAMTQEIYDSNYGLFGYANGYHAYPKQWVKDASGKLVYGSIQPEMKAVLKQLQDLYIAGGIDPEFGVKSPEKETELIATEQIGVAVGEFWAGSYLMQNAVVKDGKLVQDWAVYPLVSIDDKPALSQIELGIDGYYVVSKKAKNPEAVIKILNNYIAQIRLMSENKDDLAHWAYQCGVCADGTATANSQWQLNPMVVYSQVENVMAGKLIPEAIEANDPSILSASANWTSRYQQVQNFMNGDNDSWGYAMISKPGGGFSLMYEYLQNNLYHMNAFLGVPTPTMVERNATLLSKEVETFTKIILNQVSIDHFDNFVQEWNNLGGAAITEEVNDWYAKKNN